MSKYEAGQSIVVVKTLDRRGAGIYPATITKVGRKWVEFQIGGYFGRDRFDRESGRIDGRGFSSPGRVYQSMEEYEHVVRRETRISKIANSLDFWKLRGRLQELDDDRLTQVAALLGVDISEEPKA